MAFIDQSVLARSPQFRDRVIIAMVKTAVLIVGEALEVGKEVLHEKRHTLGVDIVQNPDLKLNAFSFAVAQNAAITATSTDGDIEFTVVTVFDDIAGVKITEI
jgi:uncharacterized protein YueI